MNEGKLPPAVLERLLRHTAPSGPEVLVGAETGEDAAVVRGGRQLVLTADPITFTEENIGLYAVAVNCNDVVAMGGRPRYLITTLLLPPRFPASRLSAIFRELQGAAATAGVLWVGGHTEVTSAVTRVVISAQAIGFLRRSPLLTSAARPGQALVMTKWAALEASTLIAREKPAEVRRLLGAGGYREVLGWLAPPASASCPRAGSWSASASPPVTTPPKAASPPASMRSRRAPAWASACGSEAIPVHPHTRAICRHFGLDPLGALSSGVFLFTAAPEEARRACAALARRGIPAATIGEITPASEKVRIERAGGLRALKRFTRDEVLKLR